MTIDEAIEKQTKLLNHPFDPFSPGERNAIKLGIEALKAWKEIRREWRRPSSMRLPGETKEYIPRDIGKLPSDEDYEKGG